MNVVPHCTALTTSMPNGYQCWGCVCDVLCSLAQKLRESCLLCSISSTPHHSGTQPSLSMEPAHTFTALACGVFI